MMIPFVPTNAMIPKVQKGIIMALTNDSFRIEMEVGPMEKKHTGIKYTIEIRGYEKTIFLENISAIRMPKREKEMTSEKGNRKWSTVQRNIGTLVEIVKKMQIAKNL